ncbi:MAG: two-component system response regulator [Pedosphaera sp.]|nr:two-component system response regulator [Pedosphaera sp.]
MDTTLISYRSVMSGTTSGNFILPLTNRSPLPTPPTILLAEDNEAEVFFFSRALRRMGITNPVQTVASGDTALAYLKGEGLFADRKKYPFPSLCLFDIKLPRMTGFEVLNAARKELHLTQLPIVIWSTSDSVKDHTEARALGASSFLVKPNILDGMEPTLAALFEQWLPK